MKLTKGQVYQHKTDCKCFRCSGVAWNKGLGIWPPKGKDHPNWKSYKMTCLMCNKDFYKNKTQLKNGEGKYCSYGCYWTNLKGKQAWNKGKSNYWFNGDKNPNWKGGITPTNQVIRHSLEYKSWRDAVFMRDNYTCQICERRNGNGETVYLQADHIKPFFKYPLLRFDLNNGRTLCIDCHKSTDTFKARARYNQFI